MYRDKTRRKQQLKLQPLAATGTDGRTRIVSAAQEPTDIDIQRAGLGVL